MPEQIASHDERRRMLSSAAAWTGLLTATVAVASISAVTAFLFAVYDRPTLANAASSCSAMSCEAGDAHSWVRIPLDGPMELHRFPTHMVMRSRLDFVVPYIVVSLLVAVSVCVLRAFLALEG